MLGERWSLTPSEEVGFDGWNVGWECGGESEVGGESKVGKRVAWD